MNKAFLTVSLALLFTIGCAVPPTMEDVEEPSADTSVVFGSVEVYENDEQVAWGTRFLGADHFYLMILPPDTNEAISYKLKKDGVFFWSLPPGDYTLLGYLWDSDTGQRSGRIGASFNVPESGTHAYIGSIELRGNVAMLRPTLHDRFGEMVRVHRQKFPGHQAEPVRALLEAPQSLGHYAAYRGQCHESWNVDCDKRFKGVTPLSPEVSQSGFPTADTLTPEFRWKGCARRDVSYDLALFEAAAYTFGGRNVPSYMRGRVVAYVEDLKEPRWRPETPLEPDSRYIWSVRMRDGDTVSGWSTQGHSTFLLVYTSYGYGQWFQFKTG